MEDKILLLVREINNIMGEGYLVFNRLGSLLSLRESSECREPKFHIFSTYKECYEYLVYLKKVVISNKINKEYSHEIWYNGEYLGIFKNISKEDACRKALRGKGLSDYEIEYEIKNIKNISSTILKSGEK